MEILGNDPQGLAHGRAAAADGVSVVIPCHNAAQRLPEALSHLERQVTPATLRWEVIIVDNNCIDGTAAVARNHWPQASGVPLRVAVETRAGSAHARQRGYSEASYEYLANVDDDNWLAPDWIATAYSTMKEYADVAVCGGQSVLPRDARPPDWFASFEEAYAVGRQWSHPGDVTDTRGFLWGAGSVVRRSAWVELVQAGFAPTLAGKVGESQVAGEDAELCLALRSLGYRLRYEPRLRLIHCVLPSRWEWKHLLALYRGFGKASVIHDAYWMATPPPGRALTAIQSAWLYQMVAAGKDLFLAGAAAIVAGVPRSPARRRARATLERRLGRLLGLARGPSPYRETLRRAKSLAKRGDSLPRSS